MFKFSNFNRLKTVNLELRNLCFQRLIVMQTANQALCSLNRMSTDKTVLGKKKLLPLHTFPAYSSPLLMEFL